MRIRWNDTGDEQELLRPDALRAVRRRRAVLVQEDAPTVLPAEPQEPEAEDTDADTD